MHIVPSRLYIQVILPLKLDWMPWYYTDGESIAVGDRVSLRFAGRQYGAVVAAVSGTPGIDPGRVLPIERVESGLERISGREIELWKFMADYYMCSVGEVFKVAYPLRRIEKEQSALRVRKRQQERKFREIQTVQARAERLRARLEKCRASLQSPHKETVTQRLKATELSLESSLAALQTCLDSLRQEGNSSTGVQLPEEESSRPASRPSNPVAVQDWPQAAKLTRMMEEGKTVLAVSAGQSGLMLNQVRGQLENGRSVLVLEAEIVAAGQLQRALAEEFGERVLLYHSSLPDGQRRDVADRLRSSKAHLVVGTRSALLLPFASLGLIVVLNEHDPSYKQDVTPRFNGRDLAAVLARIHGCGLLLCSATPSLESLVNAQSGKYLMLKEPEPFVLPPAEIIDTAAEKRKNGMVGNFSRRLIAMMARTLESGGNVLLLRTWGDVHFLRDEALPLFPEQSASCLGDGDFDFDARIVLGTMSQSKALPLSRISLVAVMLCDDLFARADFRADERALQILRQLQLRRSEGAGFVSRAGGSCGWGTDGVGGGNIVIQTSRSSHPVYRMLSGGGGAYSYDEVVKLLLQERRALNLPPYSRIVDVLIRDSSSSRLHLMASRLVLTLREVCGGSPGGGMPSAVTGGGMPSAAGSGSGVGSPVSESDLCFEGVITEPFNTAPWEADLLRIRIVLPKGKGISAAKSAILSAIAAFEKRNSYTSHIHFDVDPV